MRCGHEDCISRKNVLRLIKNRKTCENTGEGAMNTSRGNPGLTGVPSTHFSSVLNFKYTLGLLVFSSLYQASSYVPLCLLFIFLFFFSFQMYKIIVIRHVFT